MNDADTTDLAMHCSDQSPCRRVGPLAQHQPMQPCSSAGASAVQQQIITGKSGGNQSTSGCRPAAASAFFSCSTSRRSAGCRAYPADAMLPASTRHRPSCISQLRTSREHAHSEQHSRQIVMLQHVAALHEVCCCSATTATARPAASISCCCKACRQDLGPALHSRQ